MKAKDLILTLAAVASLFASCKPKDEPLPAPSVTIAPDALSFEKAAGTQTMTITATRDWTATPDADWIAVEPKSGKASKDAQTVTVKVLENTGLDREGNVKFTIGFDSKTLAVKQKGAGSAEELLVYSNDFDKEKATQAYGTDNKYWPMLDQFEGWKNQKGKGAANVEYGFSSVSVRANSESNGSHSDYPGSGVNNLFFAKDNHFKVSGIAVPAGKTDFTLSFGTEKYLKDQDNTFKPAEFHVYVSADGEKWVELGYRFPGAFKNGRWDLASVTFTVPAGTANLCIGVVSDLASAHRLDDLKLEVATAAGPAVDFSKGVEISALSGPKPAVPMAIAEAAKADKGTAVILENVLVYAKYQQGVMVGDATGFILVYDKEGVTADIKDKITVKGVVGEYGGLKQITSPEITAVSTGNDIVYPAVKAIAGNELDAYAPAAPEYISLTGTLSITTSSDKTYYNIVASGATKQGSIQYPLEGAVPADLDGKAVTVTGFVVGATSKYVNIMMTKIEVSETPILTVTPAAVTVEASVRTAKFDIASNVAWTVATGTAGVTFDKPSGNGNAAVTATFPANASTTGDVTITVTVSATGVADVTFTITQKKVLLAPSHPFASNLESNITIVEKGYLEKVKVNGDAIEYFALKLGTSSAAGKAKVKVPKGARRVGGYGVSWKDKPCKLEVVFNETVIKTIDLPVNAGATSKSPYSLVDVAENENYFEIDMGAAAPADLDVTLRTVEPFRGIIFGINAYNE